MIFIVVLLHIIHHMGVIVIVMILRLLNIMIMIFIVVLLRIIHHRGVFVIVMILRLLMAASDL
jgi:hypothetical protein